MALQLILIAALIPLAHVLQSSGTADWIGNFLFRLIGYFSKSIQPFIFLSLVYLLTMILSDVSSNAATAIIMTPITLATACQLGLDPRLFIFAICFAASALFITPVGYQTNLMVYGPGGYKFTDYIKVGLPLGIMLWILAIIFIPIFWPFAIAKWCRDCSWFIGIRKKSLMGALVEPIEIIQKVMT